MKPRIPFRIGYQYDNWELNLITLPDRIPKNDLYISYLWVGSEVKMFLGFVPHRTELIFYWDRLEAVILEFDKKSEHYYNRMNKALSKRFSKFTSETLPDSTVIFKFTTEKITYWNIYYVPSKEIKLIYFTNRFPFVNRIYE
ncbi:hypothetical protein [Chryseobacterium rhizosphaerae]|uniref:hypothetical protein n=1 Tax=Chryseobacterium rhizosphaerae TaxID=395937 RepID=UPI0023591BF2|nr:hypothetical protein [Chryseobacterium rhizosphaerae]MDC8102607.1 hypothetical protein [Chryseobacterium rhizosphaerae]